MQEIFNQKRVIIDKAGENKSKSSQPVPDPKLEKAAKCGEIVISSESDRGGGGRIDSIPAVVYPSFSPEVTFCYSWI